MEYSIEISVSVCLSVRLFFCFFCLSVNVSQEPLVQISPNFLYVLPVALAWFSSHDNEIRYVLTVFWMTSCFHIME